jgi:hypothetical protein
MDERHPTPAALPADLADRPRTELGDVPVPFVCEAEDGTLDLATVHKRRVIRCALSRICGLCGISLGWPIAFLGSSAEVAANTLRFPPLHQECGEAALTVYAPLGAGVLGIDTAPAEWEMVTTGGFELERPAGRDGDQRVAFRLHAVLGRRTPDG